MTLIAFHLDADGATHVGHVRQLNEDRFFIDPEIGVFAVADGMGGHAGGDRASAAIVERLATIGVATTAPDLRARVEDRLFAANRAILTMAEEAGATIGTTVVVVLFFSDRFACLWAGDSRLYRLRAGRLEQLTRDHSQIQELLDGGLISAEEAERWPERNVITRAVGVDPDLALDRISDVVSPGDVFLICSDGLTAHVRDDQIGPLLSGSDAATATERLIAAALAGGGSDNVTVVVIRCLAANAGDEPSDG
ncbi:PP2C family protein-serine/threonine phosphatase [Jiella marina]|uniref:PP2C family protein-serine/threonine phosphatase n=1 Tax=Jiella sp. LLJ827 TaxID=2917712 RepID=UPI002101BF10|nr:protein phosphatase 2C domain-containing protein [Jiella sp. LLJ827]MCQ0988633.1 protein phosphatase 2C domain-containing protein [Jiella sp. LLJ827]